MIEKGHEYTIPGTWEDLRAFIEAMKEEGQFSDLFATGFTAGSFWAQLYTPDPKTGLYKTHLYIKPQENSVRVRVANEYKKEDGGTAPPLAWGKIRADLTRSGKEPISVDGLEYTVVLEHSYVDPSKISNPAHRKIVKALIEAELGEDRVLQKDIANRLGYSEGQITRVKKIYLRPEYQKGNK